MIYQKSIGEVKKAGQFSTGKQQKKGKICAFYKKSCKVLEIDVLGKSSCS